MAILTTSATDALIELLLAESSIVALCSTRIEPLALPNDTEFPALVVHALSERPAAASQDGPGPTRARLQIDAWARDYRTACELDLTVLAFLVPDAATSGGSPVRRRTSLGIELQAEAVTVGDESWESDTNLYRRSRDYFIWAGAAT